MKLPLSGVETTCEKCSFAIWKNEQQTGCNAGRLEKFKQLGVVVDKKTSLQPYYKINRFCNMFRSEDQSVEDARKQISLKFGIVIFDEDEKFSNVAIESCKNLDYDNTKFKIVLASNQNKRFGRLFSTIHEFKSLNINSELVLSLNNENPKQVIEKDVFQKVFGCTHIIKVKTSDKINKSFLKRIDESINDDLETILVHEMNNLTCVQFYALNNTYLRFNDYDLTVDFLKQKSIESYMHKRYEE
jgi:hypothetical protein